MKRAIQKYLEDKVAEELLRLELKENDTFLIKLNDKKNELELEIIEEPIDVPDQGSKKKKPAAEKEKPGKESTDKDKDKK